MLRTSSKILFRYSYSITSIKITSNCNRHHYSQQTNKLNEPSFIDTDWGNFKSVYSELVTSFINDHIQQNQDLKPAYLRLKKVLDYNVPNGKGIRGFLLVKSVKNFSWPNKLSPDDLHLAYVLGWLAEMLHASFVILDDMVDITETRRGQPCWYKKRNVGLIALNDANCIEAEIYVLLRKHFSHKPYYVTMIELFREITFQCMVGEVLDLHVAPSLDLDVVTPNLYKNVARRKTGDYTVYFPIAAGMIMAGVKDKGIYTYVSKFTDLIGCLYQAKNDLEDILSDQNVTKSIGTDIQNGTCTWFISKALQLANPEQVVILKENYGKKNSMCVNKVMAVFNELELVSVFRKYEVEEIKKINKLIQEFDFPYPTHLFTGLVNILS